jgi:hypothetical protein
MLWRAGFVNAPAEPTMAASPNTGQTVLTSSPLSPTYAVDASAATAYVRTRIRRRSIRSATAPPTSASSAPGSV